MIDKLLEINNKLYEIDNYINDIDLYYLSNIIKNIKNNIEVSFLPNINYNKNNLILKLQYISDKINKLKEYEIIISNFHNKLEILLITGKDIKMYYYNVIFNSYKSIIDTKNNLIDLEKQYTNQLDSINKYLSSYTSYCSII